MLEEVETLDLSKQKENTFVILTEMIFRIRNTLKNYTIN